MWRGMFQGKSVISIHSPRTGSDPFLRALADGQLISIHAPHTHGERLWRRDAPGR